MDPVFDYIADHFDKTRQRPWAEVLEFLDAHRGNGLGLDIGCGNGRHMQALEDAGYTALGLDSSASMVEICRSKGFQVCRADMRQLPIRTGSASVILCIAALHHIDSRGDRVKALSEIVRALRPGGLALVSVWAPEDRYGTGDAVVPWHHSNGSVYSRYYHFYTVEEMEEDLRGSALDIAKWELVLRKRNIWAYIEKKRAGP